MSASGEFEISRTHWNSHNIGSYGSLQHQTYSDFERDQETRLSLSFANTGWQNSSGMAGSTSISHRDHLEFLLNRRSIDAETYFQQYMDQNQTKQLGTNSFNMGQMMQSLEESYMPQELVDSQKQRSSLFAAELQEQFGSDYSDSGNLHRVASGTGLSAIPSFLYDALSSPSDIPMRSLQYEPPRSHQNVSFSSNSQLLNENLLRETSALPSVMARQRYSTPIFITHEDDDSYISIFNNSAKGYNSVPPQGYICKLCCVEGHWLRNCVMYRERRHEYNGDLDNYLLNNSNFARPPTGFRPSPKTTIPPEGYICRKCNTPGHWIQQCTYQKISIPPDTYVCKICAIPGHWIYQCPQRTTRNSF